MAVTSTVVNRGGKQPSAPLFHDRIDVVMDASYPTGGEVLGLQALIGAGKTILSVVGRGKITSTGLPSTRFYEYNTLTDKLVALTEARAETAAAADLSLETVELYVTSF
jgi:hypothetical protein